jgi:hypothetical protein
MLIIIVGLIQQFLAWFLLNSLNVKHQITVIMVLCYYFFRLIDFYCNFKMFFSIWQLTLCFFELLKLKIEQMEIKLLT